MGQRVLIVDDEPNIANTFEAIFRSAGYEAKAAYSAEQALEVIAEWEPSVAIVDVILPLLNGIEFGKLLLSRFPECGLLLFSGQPCTCELIEQAEKEGHTFGVIAKPVHPSVLLEKTAEMLARTQERPVDPPVSGQTGTSASGQAARPASILRSPAQPAPIIRSIPK